MSRHSSFVIRHFLILPLLLAATARAEEGYTTTDNQSNPATIKGLRDGKLSTTRRGLPELIDPSTLLRLSIPYIAKFDDAELLRTSNPKAAVAFYKEAIRTANDPAVKLLIELRAVAPADADGQFTLALNYFLDVYTDSPTDAIWKFHPTHLPNAGSSMLKEASDRLALAARAIDSEDARKHLKTFQLDILTKSGDTDAAQRLAKELSTGIADTSAHTTPSSNTPPQLPPALAEIDAKLRAKQFDAALQQCDTQLALATGDTAIQLFFLKAAALEQLNQLDLATATLLRIPAHYPNSPTIPAALLQAATLEKRANHPNATQALIQELQRSYPDAPETLRAKNL